MKILFHIAKTLFILKKCQRGMMQREIYNSLILQLKIEKREK